MAMLPAGTFPCVEAAQAALCLPNRTVQPDPAAAAVYDRLFPLWRKMYFSLGTANAPAEALGAVLPELRKIARA